MSKTHYVERLPQVEIERLLGLLGRELTSAGTDGWAVELATDGDVLRLEPRTSETPDAERPAAAVARPQVVEAPATTTPMTVVASDLGAITAVHLHHGVVTFSAVETDEDPLPGGIDAPAGLRYEPLFHEPGHLEPEEANSAFVELDLAVELNTNQGRKIVVYTDGRGPVLSLSIDDRASPGWEARPRPQKRVRRVQVGALSSPGATAR